MKTVGDFKKAGLDFVEGDHTIESDGSSSKDVIDFNCCRYFNKYNNFDSSKILEFAWRENTGVKPSFSGRVEYETCDGIYNSGHTDCVNFSVRIGGKAVIKKWRPSLNQLEQNTSNNEETKHNDEPTFQQDGLTRGGKMRTETELKAAAFDSFMEAADSVKIEAPNWSSMKSAELTLMACYELERRRDKKSNSYDDKTEYFGEDYK